ncbi:hypothetical protein BJX70DRAFT_399886 [Aspergillus crustosus]
MPQLPAEILYAIVAEVTDLKDRLTSLQVCRQWHGLMLKEAYRSVNIEDAQIRRLVGVVLKNPRVAASICALHVSWSTYQPDKGDTEPLEPLDLDLVDHISVAEDKEKLRADLIRRDGEAWPVDHAFCVSKVAFRDPPFDAHPSLKYLINFTTKSCDGHDYYAPYQFLPFFYLPSMRDIRLSALKDYEVLSREDEKDHPALQAAGGTLPVNWDDRCSHFRPRLLYPPLYTQRHSLEVLHLDHEGDYGDEGGDSEYEDEEWPDPADRWFGSLADFAHLTELRIGADNILNFHKKDKHIPVTLKGILPPSLKLLHLTTCNKSHSSLLIPNLQEYLSAPDEHRPKPEEILIDSNEVETSVVEPQPTPASPHAVLRDSRLSPAYLAHFVDIEALCKQLRV